MKRDDVDVTTAS